MNQWRCLLLRLPWSFLADATPIHNNNHHPTPGGVGAYSDSKGLPIVRQEFSDFLKRRDGFGADIDNVFLCNGASEAVRLVLQCVFIHSLAPCMARGSNSHQTPPAPKTRAAIRGPQDGVLVPIPQYPLYSAAIQLLDGSLVGYYLKEETGWSLDFDELARAVADAKRKGAGVRAPACAPASLSFCLLWLVSSRQIISNSTINQINDSTD